MKYSARWLHPRPRADERARAAGQLCGDCGASDLIDASVVLCAREHGHDVLTSDPGDLAALEPAVPILRA